MSRPHRRTSRPEMLEWQHFDTLVARADGTRVIVKCKYCPDWQRAAHATRCAAHYYRKHSGRPRPPSLVEAGDVEMQSGAGSSQNGSSLRSGSSEFGSSLGSGSRSSSSSTSASAASIRQTRVTEYCDRRVLQHHASCIWHSSFASTGPSVNFNNPLQRRSWQCSKWPTECRTTHWCPRR